MKNLIIIALLIVISCQWHNYNELQDDYMHILQAIEEEIL